MKQGLLIILIAFFLSNCQSRQCNQARNEIKQLEKKLQTQKLSPMQKRINTQQLLRLQLYVKNRCDNLI